MRVQVRRLCPAVPSCNTSHTTLTLTHTTLTLTHTTLTLTHTLSKRPSRNCSCNSENVTCVSHCRCIQTARRTRTDFVTSLSITTMSITVKYIFCHQDTIRQRQLRRISIDPCLPSLGEEENLVLANLPYVQSKLPAWSDRQEGELLDVPCSPSRVRPGIQRSQCWSRGLPIFLLKAKCVAFSNAGVLTASLRFCTSLYHYYCRNDGFVPEGIASLSGATSPTISLQNQQGDRVHHLSGPFCLYKCVPLTSNTS